MQTKDYTTSFTVDQPPQAVFDAVNNVRGWWSGKIEGDTDSVESEFTYCVAGVHRSKQKVSVLIPGKKIVWRVSDAELSFATNRSEWKHTEIVFGIGKKRAKTEVRFTTGAWSQRMNATTIARTHGECS